MSTVIHLHQPMRRLRLFLLGPLEVCRGAQETLRHPEDCGWATCVATEEEEGEEEEECLGQEVRGESRRAKVETPPPCSPPWWCQNGTSEAWRRGKYTCWYINTHILHAIMAKYTDNTTRWWSDADPNSQREECFLFNFTFCFSGIKSLSSLWKHLWIISYNLFVAFHH